MFKKLVFQLLYLASIYSFSQHYTLKGTVVDAQNQPIAFSNVLIYTEDPYTYVSGTTTDDFGVFQFQDLKPDTYKIQVSYLGFETNTTLVNLSKPTNLPTIVLTEKNETLDGVTVVAKRPTVKRLVDRLIFDVENSTLSNNNMLDVLKHTPGVVVHDGTITIKQSVPTVYINDRKVHLSAKDIQQLLEGTSANNIKSIEVITNPPAKYEAEGGAVLNIITSKNILAGYNGSIFGNYKQGSEYPKYAMGTSHFFKDHKFSAYVNYNVSPRKDYRHNNEYINFIENDVVTTSWDTDFKRTRETANHTVNANLDYTFNDRNSIGFSTNMLISPREQTKTFVNSSTQVFSASNALDSIFNTNNRLVDETFNFAFTLDYIHKFKKAGERLLVSAHHTNYDFSSFQDVKTGYFYPNNSTAFRNNNFQTFSNQIIQLYTGQVDYELPFGDTSLFEAGVKVSKINSDSKLRQYNIVNNAQVEDIQNSDIFIYDEFNYAVYGSFSKDWDHWSLKLGLRNEVTNITGTSVFTNTVNNNDYLKLFPSMHLLHKLNDNNDVYLNYNKRIYRPRYGELNPFKYFLNDNAYITGDPNLKPQIDDIFTLGYTLKSKYTFELYYRFENNPTLEITFQDNTENLIKYINTNIDKSISYGLDFMTYTKMANRWNLYVLSSLFYYESEFIALESNNVVSQIDQWSLYGNIVNYFSFLKDESLTLDVSYLYISPIIDGPKKVSSRHGLDLHLKKTFWNNKASLNMGVSDVFNTQNFSSTTQYLNQDVVLNSRMENRLFTLGFNYNFGNTKLKNNAKTIDLEERERLNSKK